MQGEILEPGPAGLAEAQARHLHALAGDLRVKPGIHVGDVQIAGADAP